MPSFSHIAASAVLGLAAIFAGLNHGALFRNLRETGEAFVGEMFRRHRDSSAPLPALVFHPARTLQGSSGSSGPLRIHRPPGGIR